MRREQSKQRGFTLIELAIAIVVIGILIGAVVYFTGNLGKDSKVSKISEAIDQYLRAWQVCKLKNSALTVSNWTEFSNALRDSQCRTSGTGVPDGQGYVASAAQQIGDLSFDITAPNRLSIDTKDNYVASQVVQRVRTCTVSGTVVNCPLP